MKWKISKISIPVFDIEKSKKFYDFLLCNDTNDKKNNRKSLDECFIYGGDIELRLYKLKNEIGNNGAFQSRRTYPTLSISNLDLIIKKLDEDGIAYSNNKLNNSIIIQEPGLNYLELINLDTKIKSKKQNINNTWNFHHINLECYDVRASVNFLKKYLKVIEGKWKAPVELGKVNISPNQLSIFNLDDNHSGIHINKADFTFSWRNNFIHNPTIGGHPAFNIRDIKLLAKRLQKHDVPLTDAKVYAMPNIHQVYLFDPNSNIVEINQNI